MFDVGKGVADFCGQPWSVQSPLDFTLMQNQEGTAAFSCCFIVTIIQLSLMESRRSIAQLRCSRIAAGEGQGNVAGSQLGRVSAACTCPEFPLFR